MKLRFAIAALLAAQAARADSLDAIFARMDEAAKKFKAVTATMHQTHYIAVIQDTNEEDGELRLKRVRNGIALLVDFTGPDARTIAFEGHTLKIYYPKANQVQTIDISKYTSADTVDQLLLLSFGAASGTELHKNYIVSNGGTADAGGVMATRVELVPKSDEMKKVFTKIELWIPEGKTKAIKERVDEPSKNYVVWTFSAVNEAQLPDSAVQLKVPANAHKIGVK